MMNNDFRKIELFLGDITTVSVDAIVNAANNSLLGGGGVDDAIHAASGPNLLIECKKLKGCETGDAKITKGYNLAAKHIIHTVGPVWRGGKKNEADLLKKCYNRCFEIMSRERLKTIALPSISTGVYGYPIESASKIAVDTTQKHLTKNKLITKVIFVLFSRKDYELYKNLLLNIEKSL